MTLNKLTYILTLQSLTYIQVTLLHPKIPDRISRLARLGLIPAIIYGAFGILAKCKLSPSLASFGCVLLAKGYIAKTLEWGLVIDRTPYTYVGFDQEGHTRQIERESFKRVSKSSQESASSKDDGKAANNDHVSKHKKPDLNHKDLVQMREALATSSTWTDLFFWSLHLNYSVRGVGWAFAPARYSIDAVTPERAKNLITTSFKRFLGFESAYILLALVLWRYEPIRPENLRSLFQSVFPAHLADYLSWLPISLIFGPCAIIAMTSTNLQGAMLFWLLSKMFSLLQSSTPASRRRFSFEPREWPDSFHLNRFPSSVAMLWSVFWHDLLSRTVRFLALDPAVYYLSPYLGFRFAQAIGVLGGFGWSTWLHE